MADATTNPVPVEGEEQFVEETLSERFMDWVRTELVWYAGSFTVHLLGLSLLLLVGFSTHQDLGDIPAFEAKAPEPEKKVQDIVKYDLGEIEETPPPQLDVDPTLEKPKTEAHEEEVYDDSKVFEHRGGGSNKGAEIAGGGAGVLAFGNGPKLTGAQGIGQGLGEGKEYGKGGAGTGFGGRGSGQRKKQLANNGGTVRTERAVTAALLWLAHHQNYSEGNWSMPNYTAQCKPGDKSCTGTGDVPGCDAGATAMGLLPFLAAGQTHKSKGAYKDNISKGIGWLLRNQQADGNLAKGRIR